MAVVLVGALPWPGLRQGFNAGFRGISNVVLARVTFGKGGHAALGPIDATAAGTGTAPRLRQSVVADTVLLLRVDGHTGQLGLGLNLRREAYLPMLLFLAIVLAAPTGARAKVNGLLIGTPIVVLIAFGAVWCLGMCTFALNLRGVYEQGGVAKLATELVYRGLLLPPGNRFIVPLAIGIGLVAHEFRRRPQPPVAPLLFVQEHGS